MSEKCYPLATRMKSYEFVETDQKFVNSQPLICRVDGRSFSKFCKNFTKPYSKIISYSMIETTKYLLNATKADIAYHQSDEISLLFKPIEGVSSRMFDGKKMKLNSVISGMASAFFIKTIMEECKKENVTFPNSIPHFDSRLFSVPNMVEAGNYFVWRQQDAKRNSISMMAQSLFSHKELQGKSGTEMLLMIENSVGDKFYKMPFNFRHGSFFAKEKVEKQINGESCVRTEIKEYDIETITYQLLEPYIAIMNKIKEYGKKSFLTDEQIEYSKNYDGDITVGKF